MNDDKNTEEEEKKLPEESTEIDTAPTTEVSMPEDEVQHAAHSQASTNAADNSNVGEIPATWIKIENGKFKCSECENEVEPETNTIEGVVKADLDQIKADLKQYPTKVVYGICPVCGMEFVFRLKDEDLYLEPSDLEK